MKKILFLIVTATLMTACGQKDKEQPQSGQEKKEMEVFTYISPESMTATPSEGTSDQNITVLSMEEGKPLDLSQLSGGGMSKEELVASQIDSIRYKAEHGDVNYQYAYGVCYEKGWGVDKDLKQAVAWYQKAAQQNNGPAFNSLGNFYRMGTGVKADPKQAFEYYVKGAAVNDDQAMLNLGNCYFYGMGTEKDGQAAVQWWEKAAEKGNIYAISQMGDCYYYGLGVEKDIAKAVEKYTQAADRNVPSAQYSLGVMYYTGTGVEQDRAYAKLLMKKAADGGMKEAKDFLEKAFKE